MTYTLPGDPKSVDWLLTHDVKLLVRCAREMDPRMLDRYYNERDRSIPRRSQAS